MVTPASKRAAAGVMVTAFRRSQRKACELTGLWRSSCRYAAHAPLQEELRQKLRELAMKRPRFGYRRLLFFIQKAGHRVNHKRLFRLYRSEGLGLPRKRPRKRLWMRQTPLTPAERPMQRWSMDFEMDFLGSGRRFRSFNIVDDCTRECPGLLVDTSIGGIRVTRFLDELAKTNGLPGTMVVDNGSEFTSRAFLAWAEKRGITLHFIDPGKPNQNAFIESFNGKFRDECLNGHWFTTLEDARRTIEEWRIDYNDVRPHSSLNNLTPAEFRASITARETAA